MYTITIKNCKNVCEADITINEGMLNIKYGYNGTGKSTISEAIRLKSEGKDLKGLTPFCATDSLEANEPTVENMPFHTVKVFND